MSEIGAIVLLIVATGYVLAISQKKYPPSSDQLSGS